MDRRCARCHQLKSRDAFHIIKGKPHPWCMGCRNDFNRMTWSEKYGAKKDFVDEAEPLVKMCRHLAKNQLLIDKCDEWLSKVAAARIPVTTETK